MIQRDRRDRQQQGLGISLEFIEFLLGCGNGCKWTGSSPGGHFAMRWTRCIRAFSASHCRNEQVEHGDYPISRRQVPIQSYYLFKENAYNFD